MSEVPFPQPMDALLLEPPGKEKVGWLTFVCPKGNHRTSLPITLGPTRGIGDLEHVWHIDIHDDGTATTFPSVHSKGSWHTPLRCRWNIVDHLADE